LEGNNVHKLTPKTHIIQSLIHAELPNGPRSALSEFIDNSFGLAAGNAQEVQISVGKDEIVIADNGNGVEDINALFTLGDSQSRLSDSDIGNFGYGSKVGALYLGYKVGVHTVHNGVYHKFFVDWEKVEMTELWPNGYRAFGHHPDKAPEFIRNGGTIITISGRHKHRGNWDLFSLGEKLGHTYTPALTVGRKIKLFKVSGNKIQSTELNASQTSKKLSNVIDFHGEVKGKSFRVRAGTKHNQTKAMNAIHIAYGHRFIKSVRSLPVNSLPSDFYAEVFLSKEWKRSLTAAKNDISVDKQELLFEVEAGVEELLNKLNNRADEVRIELLNSELANCLQSAVSVINMNESGEKTLADIIDIRERQRKPVNPNPNPNPDKEVANVVKDGGNYGEKEAQSKGCGISMSFEPAGDKKAFSVDGDTRHLHISLNKDIKMIEEAKAAPYNCAAIWALVVSALVDYIFESPEERAHLITGLEAVINKSGGVEDEHKDKLYFDLLDKAPNMKEPSPSEIKAASQGENNAK
jgi:hypothetical protein